MKRTIKNLGMAMGLLLLIGQFTSCDDINTTKNNDETVVIANKIKGMQSGKVQDYAFGFIAGVVVLAMVFIYLWTN